MAVLSKTLRTLLFCTFGVTVLLRGACAAGTPTEYQVKAVFLYNFSHFVDWPPQSFSSPDEPFVIGVLGGDPFGARLDEAVHGEHIDQHPLLVRRFRNVGEIGDCRILYIDRSKSGELAQILTALDHRATLTVSELDGSSQRGVMIQFVTESNRIRLRINVESARAAGLTISSKLLRPAEIVGPRTGD